MLIRKSDRRRCHPCIAIAIGALAVIGAVSVTEKGRAWLSSKMTRAKAIMKRNNMSVDLGCAAPDDEY